MENMNNVYTTLEKIQIPFTEYEHKAVFTVAESKDIDKMLSGTNTKNLFIRNKKGDNHWLVIIEGEIRADINKLRKFFPQQIIFQSKFHFL